MYIYIYSIYIIIYIYLEPVCPLFLALSPPKQGLFQSKPCFHLVSSLYMFFQFQTLPPKAKRKSSTNINYTVPTTTKKSQKPSKTSADCFPPELLNSSSFCFAELSDADPTFDAVERSVVLVRVPAGGKEETGPFWEIFCC